MKEERKIYAFSNIDVARAAAFTPGRVIRKKPERVSTPLTIPTFTSTAHKKRKNSGEKFYTHHRFRNEKDKNSPETERILFTGVRAPQKAHDFEHTGVGTFFSIDCRIFKTDKKMFTAGKKVSETLAERFERRCRFSEGHKILSEGHGFIPTGRISEAETHEIFSEDLNPEIGG
jgi:hypothetical protein